MWNLTSIWLLMFLALIDRVRLECIENPCDRPPFCTEGQTAANPFNCESYYICVFSEWVPQDCAATTSFDYMECRCKFTDEAKCFSECPTSTIRTTLLPGSCSNVPDPCTDGVKYPDRSSCQHYYPCSNGVLGGRTECLIGYEPECLEPGVPCVFDIYLGNCIVPDGSFNCDYRCITTLPPPSTPAMSTITVDDLTTSAEIHDTTSYYFSSSPHMDTTTSEYVTSDRTTTNIPQTSSQTEQSTVIITSDITTQSVYTTSVDTTEAGSTIFTTESQDISSISTSVDPTVALSTKGEGSDYTSESIVLTTEHDVITTTLMATTTPGPDKLSAVAISFIVILSIGCCLILVIIILYVVNRKKIGPVVSCSEKDDTSIQEDFEQISEDFDKNGLINFEKASHQVHNPMLWRLDQALSAENGHTLKWRDGENSLVNFTAPYMENPLYGPNQGNENSDTDI